MVNTFPPMIGTITHSYSEVAQEIYDRQQENERMLENAESYYPVLIKVLPELNEVIRDISVPNWDGYGALPVNEKTIERAKDFLRALPSDIPAPSVDPEPDGLIAFEWYRSAHRTLSVSVSPTGELYYSALIGPEKAYGTEIFYHKLSSSRIPDLIKQICQT